MTGDRDALHRCDPRIRGPRERVPSDRLYRQPRGDGVAEPAPASLRRGVIRPDAVEDLEPGQQRREERELVAVVVAGERRVREVVGEFLDAQQVEVGERLRVRDDSRGIDAAIQPAEPLHVPGDERDHAAATAGTSVRRASRIGGVT